MSLGYRWTGGSADTRTDWKLRHGVPYCISLIAYISSLYGTKIRAHCLKGNDVCRLYFKGIWFSSLPLISNNGDRFDYWSTNILYLPCYFRWKNIYFPVPGALGLATYMIYLWPKRVVGTTHSFQVSSLRGTLWSPCLWILLLSWKRQVMGGLLVPE